MEICVYGVGPLDDFHTCGQQSHNSQWFLLIENLREINRTYKGSNATSSSSLKRLFFFSIGS